MPKITDEQESEWRSALDIQSTATFVSTDAANAVDAELKELREIAEGARNLSCPSCGWIITDPPLRISPCSACGKVRERIRGYFAPDAGKEQPK